MLGEKMSDERETYLLKIEGVSPHQMPLAKLIEYIRAAEQLLGVGQSVHLVGIRDASTGAALLIDEGARQQAEAHVQGAPAGFGPTSVVRGYNRLVKLAENDNQPVRLVRPDGSSLIEIAPAIDIDAVIGPVKQLGTLQGHVVGVFGRDDTKHIRLQDGVTVYAGIEADEKLATELGKHLFVPTVRLTGTGWWTRQSELGWKLGKFKATDFDVLEDGSLLEVAHELRSLEASTWSKREDPWDDLASLRSPST